MSKETLEALQKKISQADRKIATLSQERRQLQSKYSLLNKRLQLEQLIGKELGVVIGYVARPGLRGKPGTVTKVNRTRAIVLVDGESWSFCFENLKLNNFDYQLEASINRGLGIS